MALSGCSSAAALPAMPTPVATYTVSPALAQPTGALDMHNLLDAPVAQPVCESPPDGELFCTQADGNVRMETAIHAGIFTRWSLPLAGEPPALTGNETLALHMRRTGDVSPNLYLVDDTDLRIPMALNAYGLDETWKTIHVPLREVYDRDGLAPRFDELRTLEIVFEWAEMAGTVEIDAIGFVPTWGERVDVDRAAVALADDLRLPDGFDAEAIADDLLGMTQIDFTSAGDMLVALQNGRVWRFVDDDGDGVYDRRHLYDSGYTELVGLLTDPVDGAVWLGGRGQLYRTLDSDGDGAADRRALRVDGLPWGRHQNNGLAWNPEPDPFTGEPAATWLYFGLGSTGDLDVGGPLNATVLRFPRDGNGAADLEIVSQGNRNAYMVTWGAVPVDLNQPDGETAWQLFASENGPDFNDAPDEVNHIRWQHHYGFPDQFGFVAEGETDGAPYSGPLYPVTPHASASGLAFIDNPAWPAAYRTLYVSLFGEVFSQEVVGHTVERVALETSVTPDGGVIYRGEPSDFVTGLVRPLPMATGPAGNLIVGDYATGVIYRVAYVGDQ